MHIHFIQHEIFEAPGAYLKWAAAGGHHIRFSRVYENQPLPGAAGNIDLLVIMGGPQQPDTTIAECPHFNSKAEQAFIKACIDAGKPVVGVCLGSQLIGAALGAAHTHSPEPEIGNFPIQLTEDGMKDENINHFGALLTVGHWHNDMPGLTPHARVLAISEGCPRQIIRYAEGVYGFQCHMELTKEVVELLIASEPGLETKSGKYRFVQSPDEILNYDYSEMNARLYQFLNKLTTKR